MTQSDDPYRPYYPGDEHVDWVGQSLYHFGDSYPWGENAVPEPGKFAAKLTGTYEGLAGDEEARCRTSTANCSLRPGKPLAISETSALYNQGQAGVGASSHQIKAAWLAQVFADDLPACFPGLRLIMWFEQDKLEPDVPGGATSWSLSRDPSLIQIFRRAVPSWLDEARLIWARTPPAAGDGPRTAPAGTPPELTSETVRRTDTEGVSLRCRSILLAALTLLVSLLAVPTAVAAAAPTVTLSPASGLAGGSTLLAATGFPSRTTATTFAGAVSKVEPTGLTPGPAS